MIRVCLRLPTGRDCGLGVDTWKDARGSPMYTQSSKNTTTVINPTSAAWNLLTTGTTSLLLRVMLGGNSS